MSVLADYMRQWSDDRIIELGHAYAADLETTAQMVDTRGQPGKPPESLVIVLRELARRLEAKYGR